MRASPFHCLLEQSKRSSLGTVTVTRYPRVVVDFLSQGLLGRDHHQHKADLPDHTRDVQGLQQAE